MAVAPKVFVVDAEGKPLLPTHPARSRKLIREGKAVVLRMAPYTIQLNRVVDNPVGSFTLGIDDGAKEVGISVKKASNIRYQIIKEEILGKKSSGETDTLANIVKARANYEHIILDLNLKAELILPRMESPYVRLVTKSFMKDYGFWT